MDVEEAESYRDRCIDDYEEKYNVNYWTEFATDPEKPVDNGNSIYNHINYYHFNFWVVLDFGP